MKTNQETAEKITLLRSLRGCPATIIFALALFGCKMTNKDLQLATGYSDKPITAALELLTLHRMVVNTGKSGWTLSDGMKQLPLFPEALLDPESVQNGPQIIAGEARRSEYFRSSSLSSSSSSRSTTHSGSAAEEEKQPQHRKISEHGDKPVDNFADDAHPDIEAQLIKAGIGRNSQKFNQILNTNPDPAHIHAHINYYRWWHSQNRQNNQATAIDGRTCYPIGLLITRILDRDPAPPLHCLKCGRLQTNCICHIIPS